MRKSIKQKIWEKLAEDNYITDSELYTIYGCEPNFYSAQQMKDEYFRLKQCLEVNNYHKDPTTEIQKGYRKYFVRNQEIKRMGENRWMKIPKVYFDYLKKMGVKIIL